MSSERRTRTFRALILASSAVVVTAVVSTAGVSAASAATPTVESVTSASFGTILATGSGLALYTLTTDHNGQSTCHGSCAVAWPPLTVPAGTVATAAAGVTGVVGTSKQSNGTFQVTYNGSPLYTFVGDSAPGQVTGNGVSDFFVVTVAPAATTTTTGAAPGGTAPSGTAAPSGTTAPPAPPASPTSASAGSTPSTAPASGPAPGVTAAGPGALAFTGAGPGLRSLLVLGLVLVFLGVLITKVPGRRTRTPRPTVAHGRQ
jgi:predicted lipoprotein with Yx(FWY)xxD motif